MQTKLVFHAGFESNYWTCRKAFNDASEKNLKWLVLRTSRGSLLKAFCSVILRIDEINSCFSVKGLRTLTAKDLRDMRPRLHGVVCRFIPIDFLAVLCVVALVDVENYFLFYLLVRCVLYIHFLTVLTFYRCINCRFFLFSAFVDELR